MNDDVAPILTLEKTVTNDDGGTSSAERVDADRDHARRADLTGTTGTAGSRPSPFRRAWSTRSASPAPAAYELGEPDVHGLPRHHAGSADTHAGAGDNVTCTLNNDDILVPVSIAKADGAVQQLADGTWSISYQVIVTNTSADAADHLFADRHPGVRLELHDPVAGMAG